VQVCNVMSYALYGIMKSNMNRSKVFFVLESIVSSKCVKLIKISSSFCIWHYSNDLFNRPPQFVPIQFLLTLLRVGFLSIRITMTIKLKQDVILI
jgi:hypothetical protein